MERDTVNFAWDNLQVCVDTDGDQWEANFMESHHTYLLHGEFSTIQGLIVNIFKKWNREDLGNYRGIPLLSVVG